MKNGFTILTATSGQERIGGAIMLHQGETGYLWLGAVLEPGKGAGSELLKAALKEAWRLGMKSARAKTSIHNGRAFAQLLRHGFSQTCSSDGIAVFERKLEFQMGRNTLPFTPKCVRSAMRDFAFSPLHEYLDLKSSAADAVAKAEGVRPENVVFTSNCNDAIRAVAPLLSGQRVLMPSPIYPVIENEVRAVASAVEVLGLNCSPSAAMAKIRGNAAFMCNPNNPTGYLLKGREIVRMASLAKLLIIDEAYSHFAHFSSSGLVQKAPVVVLKTTSKYGAASCALGIIIARGELLGKIRIHSEPSGIALALAMALFSKEGQQELRSIVEGVEQERKRVFSAMCRLGYDVLPSNANFLLAKEKNNESGRLALRGVLTKKFSLQEGEFMRVTIRSDFENDIFLEALGNL